jgi:hypothetical protein
MLHPDALVIRGGTIRDVCVRSVVRDYHIPSGCRVATIAESASYENDRPAMVSSARAMAKILDDPQLIG